MAFPTMDPFEAHLRKGRLFDDTDTKTFVRPGEPNAESRLADIGERLAEVIAKQNESRRLTAELWRRYLLDCKCLGVAPRPRPI